MMTLFSRTVIAHVETQIVPKKKNMYNNGKAVLHFSFHYFFKYFISARAQLYNYFYLFIVHLVPSIHLNWNNNL